MPVTGAPSTSESLIGSWNLVGMPGDDGLLGPPIEGSRIQALFDEAGSVAGSAGCNMYRGSYRARDGAITVERLATTQRLCARPPGVMEQEARYLELLAATTRYSSEDENTVRLSDASGDVVIVLERVADR